MSLAVSSFVESSSPVLMLSPLPVESSHTILYPSGGERPVPPGRLAKNPFPRIGSLGKERLPFLSTVGGCDEVWLRFSRRLFVSMWQCVPRELFSLGFAIAGFATVTYIQSKLNCLLVLEKLMYAWICVHSPSRCHRCVANVTSYFLGVGGF